MDRRLPAELREREHNLPAGRREGHRVEGAAESADVGGRTTVEDGRELLFDTIRDLQRGARQEPQLAIGLTKSELAPIVPEGPTERGLDAHDG